MLSTQTEQQVTIATVEGTNKITAINAEELKTALNKVLSGGNNKVALSLENIDFIDSSGFACFISAMKTANNNYGSFKICNVGDEVLRIFKMLHLDSVFELYTSKEECIKAFS